MLSSDTRYGSLLLKNQKNDRFKYFRKKNFIQEYMLIQFNIYKIKKFCKQVFIIKFFCSFSSKVRLKLKNQKKTIKTKCQNLAITQIKT